MSCPAAISFSRPAGLLLFAVALLGGCGGGSGDSPSGSPLSPAPSGPPTTAQRVQAATATAQNNAACTAIQPFYWEVGDRTASLASGSVGSAAPTAASSMLIASASKWMFGAYVLERRLGMLNDGDITALTMRTGYTHLNYSRCLTTPTVAECASAAHFLDGYSNNSLEPTHVGRFFYNGGHFQQHAVSSMGLGIDDNASLKINIANYIGQDFSFSFDSPQLAAGVATTPTDYTFFLRKILSNQLRIGGFLGAYAVCTNPNICATAVSTPIPLTESWRYSLGHWVEDDPAVGDGAFSSPGAFGFYPWIDSGKTWYGVVARDVRPTTVGDSVAFGSVSCGRLIRKAWLTGTQQ